MKWVSMLKRSIGGENFYIPLPQIIFFITYHNEVSAIFLKLWCLIYFSKPNFSFSSGQSLSRAWLSANPWVTARQASLSITNSWSLLKLMSIESVKPSNHLIEHFYICLLAIFMSLFLTVSANFLPIFSN